VAFQINSTIFRDLEGHSPIASLFVQLCVSWEDFN